MISHQTPITNTLYDRNLSLVILVFQEIVHSVGQQQKLSLVMFVL